MSKKQNENPAIKVFSEQNTRAENLSFGGESSFLDGKVCEVFYKEDDSQNEKTAYVILVGDCKKIAYDTRGIIQQLNDVAEKELSKQKPSWWEKFLNLSGLIALILVLAIIYMAIFTEREVPEFLTATFLTIMGFYFGGIKDKVS